MQLQKVKFSDHNDASKILKHQRRDLIHTFLTGKAPDYLKQNTGLFDDYFRKSFETSLIGPQMDITKNPYAIIALGGYGRQEQCYYSDIDIAFIFEKYVPDEAEQLVQEIIYPLWDLGLEVGHTTRSIKECVSKAQEDIEILTSILDGRFICGMSLLYSTLMERMRKIITKRRSKKIITTLVKSSFSRHKYFGDSAYLLEPNLKEGQGGLRDFHTMMWILRLKSNLIQLKDMEYEGYLSREEIETLKKSLEFITKVRNHLHYITKRKCDRLHFEYQTKIAAVLKFDRKNDQQPVERFLSTLHGHMEFLKQRHLMFLYELGYKKGQASKNQIKSFFRSGKSTRINGLVLTQNLSLNFKSSENILSSPDLLIKIFEESARLQIPLSAEAKRLIKEFSYLIDDDFINFPSNIKSFERILETPAPVFNVLNEMLNTGFLSRFIPEFTGIINRIQYDEYHLYPVDLHSLKTVKTIKDFLSPEINLKNRLCADLYKELKKKSLLLWAALLHDIGKSKPGGNHSITGAKIVEYIFFKKGFSPEDIDTISFLIKEHLLLIKTATRRDINDEETAVYCARKIGNSTRLKMLYLLTVADSMSTGPSAWGDWINTLLRDLFFKVMTVIEKGELATTEAVETIENKKAAVFATASGAQNGKDLEEIVNFMSPRYLLYTPAENILEHVDLYRTLGIHDFVWQVTRIPDSDTRTVTICAKDRPGLFSKIAGTFTLNNLDILDAQIFTWQNKIALDIFEVKPPADRIFEKEKWHRAKKRLQSALKEKINLSIELAEKISEQRFLKRLKGKRPSRINVDNNSSSFFTIIEVITYDFPGLLFAVTDALFKCHLDIRIAKISTKIDQVVDVFYVRDCHGQKIDDPGQVEEIKKEVGKVLPRFDDLS